MTKLDVSIELPSEKRGETSQPIRCVGVIFRQETEDSPGKPPSYLTAFYFSDVKQDDRCRIAEFVLRCMLSHDRRRS